ncbi:MAG: hypothetical protein HYY51_01845 [Candidatus Magasanikbacteria bacterium]|nr:hypothetical protein [Candidatus Magasanikbacteria bacterium]
MYKDRNILAEALSNQNEDYWINVGEETTLRLFHEAASRVPAYADFLSKHNIKHKDIGTFKDFLDYVPVTDKEQYIDQYGISELYWDGDLTRGSIIAQSSGTSGRPRVWPRGMAEEARTALLHDALFAFLFDTYRQKTLFIDCFHLGIHIAGMITAYAIKTLLDRGMPGSLCTPGLHLEDIISCIERLSSSFDQTILIGYPPFLKDVVEKAREKGLPLETYNIKFVFAAESFPEKWRDLLGSLSGTEDIEKNAINIYGSADLGFMAHETPFTIGLRRCLLGNSEFSGMFGYESGFVPPLFQYHPWDHFFEEQNGELLCSADAGIPLLRYNIKDRGMIIPFKDLEQSKFLSPELLASPHWRLPVVGLLGRSGQYATIYGLNVFPEHIREILAEDELKIHLSGKFFMATRYEGVHQILELHLELIFGRETNEVRKEDLTAHIIRYLEALNLEYKKLRSVVGEKAEPRLWLYEKDAAEFKTNKMKQEYLKKIKQNEE